MVHVINNYNKDMCNIAYECSLEFSGISTSLEPRLFEVHQVHGVFLQAYSVRLYQQPRLFEVHQVNGAYFKGLRRYF